MYETLEHWNQYKQEKATNKSMKMTPFLIKLQAEKEMDKFINKLVKENGTTKY